MNRYAAILADPPWKFATWSEKGRDRSPDYQTEPVSDLADFKLPAGDDCALFMWAVDAHLVEAIGLMTAWGFVYKTIAFIWVKPQMGLGYWSRKEAEVCLLGTRGKPKRLSRGVRQVIRAPRREHSRKPDEIFGRIEALVGGPYLELFARQRRPGWDVAYSNEADKFTPATCGAPHCPEVCVEGYCARRDSAGSYEAACRALAQRVPQDRGSNARPDTPSAGDIKSG